ncbi:DUF47 domain-containing protein [Nocardia fluminea]|uniref:DUF47 domain-containing protein n=1 Tax=Nocardia fluminea TaxID=134984 RepID=UPI00365914A4
MPLDDLSANIAVRDYFRSVAQNLVIGGEILWGFRQPGVNTAVIHHELSAAAQVSDNLVADLRRALENSQRTAAERSDLQRLAQAMASVMDHMAAAGAEADRFAMDSLPVELTELVELICDGAQRTTGAVRAQPDPIGLNVYRRRLEQLADSADSTYRRLFTRWLTDGGSPSEIAEVSAVGDELEYAIHALETVAHIIEELEHHHGGRILS